MIYLKEGTSLQGGKYRIEKVLGQGGFGITYLGEHIGLKRKVAIKEFFMKEYCNREQDTSHVTVPSVGSKDLVERFRQKFVKEAQTISDLENRHIVRIHDVFEEQGTAYYVMEYLPGGDLRSRIPKNGMKEANALPYIRQIADALLFVHERNILHLDVKPSNVLFRSNGEAVLVDFGLSKHYDESSGEQTSSTPLGISEGYAPTEQYESSGVSSFSPATDIYSLGATFYCLLQGSRPPKASVVLNDGLPVLPISVSSTTCKAIVTAMQPKRNDRPQSVDAFLSLLDSSLENADEETLVDVVSSVPNRPVPPIPTSQTPGYKPFPWKWSLPLIACLVLLLGLIGWNKFVGFDRSDDALLSPDSLVSVDTIPVISPIVANPIEPIKGDVPSTTPLYVSTSPVGATIYLDGKKVGKSPFEGQEVSRGNHTVKLVLEGYETFTKKYFFGEKPVVISETLVSAVSIVAPVRTLEKEEVPKLVPVKASTVDTSSLVSVDTALSLEKEETPQPKSVNIPTTGTINGHEWVDLGLSVKWATMNIGATDPDDYGDYFAWGEVHPKSEYTKKNSVTRKEKMNEISGNSNYDVARYHWGGSWRLPTRSELDELLAKCSWSWVTQNGHKGYKFIGPNGNSIFLPAAGYRHGSSNADVGKDGNYWSGSPYGWGSDPEGACGLYFYKGYLSLDWLFRHNGRSIRPVLD